MKLLNHGKSLTSSGDCCLLGLSWASQAMPLHSAKAERGMSSENHFGGTNPSERCLWSQQSCSLPTTVSLWPTLAWLLLLDLSSKSVPPTILFPLYFPALFLATCLGSCPSWTLCSWQIHLMFWSNRGSALFRPFSALLPIALWHLRWSVSATESRVWFSAQVSVSINIFLMLFWVKRKGDCPAIGSLFSLSQLLLRKREG